MDYEKYNLVRYTEMEKLNYSDFFDQVLDPTRTGQATAIPFQADSHVARKLSGIKRSQFL